MAACAVPDPLAATVSLLRSAGCVFAEDEARLLLAAARTPVELDTLVARRVAGLPLEHLLGWAEFCRLRIAVDDGVFVPRKRTEFLVRQAIALARRSSHQPAAVVVDLCCGSGAVAAAVAAGLDRVELHAADLDPAAVRCARRNLAADRVYQGDLYQALPDALRGRIDVLVANAPYVPTEAIGLMPPEARCYEARIALDGGPDGLDVHRRLAAEAPAWLAPGGRLLVEASPEQASAAVALFTGHGLLARTISCPELAATVVIGRKPTGPDDPGKHR